MRTTPIYDKPSALLSHSHRPSVSTSSKPALLSATLDTNRKMHTGRTILSFAQRIYAYTLLLRVCVPTPPPYTTTDSVSRVLSHHLMATRNIGTTTAAPRTQLPSSTRRIGRCEATTHTRKRLACLLPSPQSKCKAKQIQSKFPCKPSLRTHQSHKQTPPSPRTQPIAFQNTLFCAHTGSLMGRCVFPTRFISTHAHLGRVVYTAAVLAVPLFSFHLTRTWCRSTGDDFEKTPQLHGISTLSIRTP